MMLAAASRLATRAFISTLLGIPTVERGALYLFLITSPASGRRSTRRRLNARARMGAHHQNVSIPKVQTRHRVVGRYQAFTREQDGVFGCRSHRSAKIRVNQLHPGSRGYSEHHGRGARLELNRYANRACRLLELEANYLAGSQPRTSMSARREDMFEMRFCWSKVPTQTSLGLSVSLLRAQCPPLVRDAADSAAFFFGCSVKPPLRPLPAAGHSAGRVEPKEPLRR